jgi:hypothetical protein
MNYKEFYEDLMNRGLVIYQMNNGYYVSKRPTPADPRHSIGEAPNSDTQEFPDFQQAVDWCAAYCEKPEPHPFTAPIQWHCVVQTIYKPGDHKPKYWRLEPDITATNPDEAQELAEIAAEKEFGAKGEGWKEVRIRPL